MSPSRRNLEHRVSWPNSHSSYQRILTAALLLWRFPFYNLPLPLRLPSCHETCLHGRKQPSPFHIAAADPLFPMSGLSPRPFLPLAPAIPEAGESYSPPEAVRLVPIDPEILERILPSDLFF